MCNYKMLFFIIFSATMAGELKSADGVDPLFDDQWHLVNTGQAGGTPGEDLNVEPVWADGTIGVGVRIAIVDDGLEIFHEDLRANLVEGASYNYLTQGTDPTGGRHGTSVAGIVAAVGFNRLGVRGVAPGARLVGYNFLQESTSTNAADALTRGLDDNAIYSNSWGAPEGGMVIPADQLTQDAIAEGLTSGRGGLGAIYVFSAGNGAPIDNSNYDGLKNLRGVIAVGAVTNQGTKASYSEKGANLWISAPGGESCDTHTITTTDRSGSESFNDGTDDNDYMDTNYTRCFRGTSAAAPAASGAIALMLDANPGLGWRDVRLILAQTARQNDPDNLGWSTNGGNFTVNHKYGFGVINAEAAVSAAKTWTNVGEELTYEASSAVNLPIDDAIGQDFGTPVSDTINVTNSGISFIEYIDVTFDSNHEYSGDLKIVLKSPSGTKSKLAVSHLCPGTRCAPYASWRFGTARHLGESADGDWTLKVKDGQKIDTGNFGSWKLKIYGTANTPESILSSTTDTLE